MGRSLCRKSGSKRPKTPDMFEDVKRKRKSFDHQKIQKAFPVTIDTNISSEEDDASMQLPIYDNLLRTFGSGRDVLEDFHDISCFHHHFGHVLTNEEVDKLTKEKLKFKWEIPVKEMNMSKLVGTGQDFSTELSENPFCGLNHQLYNHWKNFYSSSNSGDSCSSKRRLFFSLYNTYRDIMHCDKRPFYLKGKEDDSSIMDAYIMHVLNHIHRIREQVLKNDAKLNKDENSKMEEIQRGGTYLDQGFTRPKVMLLLPLASIAFRVVKRLVQLSPLSHKGNVAYMDRFSDEFGTGDVGGDEKNTDGSLESQKRAKPVDFQTLFSGNNNDHFMIGIKFTKRSINLYSNFYSSDIIVASPLGLITGHPRSECGLLILSFLLIRFVTKGITLSCDSTPLCLHFSLYARPRMVKCMLTRCSRASLHSLHSTHACVSLILSIALAHFLALFNILSHLVRWPLLLFVSFIFACRCIRLCVRLVTDLACMQLFTMPNTRSSIVRLCPRCRHICCLWSWHL